MAEQTADYRCACPSPDAAECAAIRYGFDFMHEHCDCPCHYSDWDDDDEYAQTAPNVTAQTP
jgi:hypothetical protein